MGGVNVSSKHSVVALSSESFCHMSSFYDQYVDTDSEYFNVQNALNENPVQKNCTLLTFAARYCALRVILLWRPQENQGFWLLPFVCLNAST